MIRDIKGSKCMITSNIIASVLFMLSPGMTFLLICIINPAIKLSAPGELWILFSSILGVLNVAFTIPYSLVHFSYVQIRTSKYYIFTIVMDVFILIQAWVLLQGTIKYSIWSVGSDVMHTCYLLVMIFGWVFSPIYWAVFITCEVVFRFRVRHFESMKLVDPSADPSRVPTCCCAPQPGEEDCCACCDVCCSGMSMNVGRSRYNNSCCCDGCCNCCIDCCVQFCGETNGPLPPGLQNEDIVYGPNGNRMIYMPNNSLPVVNPVVNPVVTPVVTPIVTPVYPINPAVQPNPDMIPMAIPVNPPTPGYTPVGVYPSMAAPVEVSPVYVTPVTMPNQPMGYPAGAVPLPANYANNPF